ncbi:MAG: hypothetical protein RIE31_00850 [Alphaproteobacteria bacterium]
MIEGLFAGLLGLALFALALWIGVRILQKAGLSGWWALLTLVPPLGVVGVWVFAFVRWPAVDGPESGGGDRRAPGAPPPGGGPVIEGSVVRRDK